VTWPHSLPNRQLDHRADDANERHDRRSQQPRAPAPRTGAASSVRRRRRFRSYLV